MRPTIQLARSTDVRSRTYAKPFGVWASEKRQRIREPEDHAAILCEIMAGLVGGSIAAPDGADRDFFERRLAPWIRRFLPIWSTLNQLTFTLVSARLGELSWTLK